MEDRKRAEMNKPPNLPPNPPSMLARKRSISEQRRNLELNLLHHPDLVCILVVVYIYYLQLL